MIPKEFIQDWASQNISWQSLDMVEQDLIISRALICLYSNPIIKNNLVFRGGTALNKLYLKPSSRYSEDIDLVQIKGEPIGKTIEEIRKALNWLGKPAWIRTNQSVKLVYKYISVNQLPMKLKLEINTTEHFQVLELDNVTYNIDSEWFKGECKISVYQLEELMATKLRALYQRRKGRDLFDLWLVFSRDLVDISKTIGIFKEYCRYNNIKISKDEFIKNLEEKRKNQDFRSDMSVLLPSEAEWNFDQAFDYVVKEIIAHI
jgi:predicted nucleotidyltransferase component of viral defense system